MAKPLACKGLFVGGAMILMTMIPQQEDTTVFQKILSHARKATTHLNAMLLKPGIRIVAWRRLIQTIHGNVIFPRSGFVTKTGNVARTELAALAAPVPRVKSVSGSYVANV